MSKKIILPKIYLNNEAYCIFYKYKTETKSTIEVIVDEIILKNIRGVNSSSQIILSNNDIGKKCIVVLCED